MYIHSCCQGFSSMLVLLVRRLWHPPWWGFGPGIREGIWWSPGSWLWFRHMWGKGWGKCSRGHPHFLEGKSAGNMIENLKMHFKIFILIYVNCPTNSVSSLWDSVNILGNAKCKWPQSILLELKCDCSFSPSILWGPHPMHLFWLEFTPHFGLFSSKICVIFYVSSILSGFLISFWVKMLQNVIQLEISFPRTVLFPLFDLLTPGAFTWFRIPGEDGTVLQNTALRVGESGSECEVIQDRGQRCTQWKSSLKPIEFMWTFWWLLSFS